MQPRHADAGPSYAEHPDLAIVALLFMLSRYPRVQCARMSDSILAHLIYVAGDVRYPDSIREAAGRIHQEFQFLNAEPPSTDGARTLN